MNDTAYVSTTKTEDYAKDNHAYTATTEELIVLAAHWHVEAEAVDMDAILFGEGVTSSQWESKRYAQERRNRICDHFLDHPATAEAITRGEEMLLKRWGLSLADWQVFRHGPDAEYDRLIERVRAVVRRRLTGPPRAEADHD